MNNANATNERGIDGITERLRTIRDGLCVGLVERDVPVRLALLAAVSGEHLLLLGPPGTAKSLIARRLRLAFADATYFERLLTRFSVPEELFGPLSIKGLEEDRYERQTDRYLPTASVAFLDEIFKANSAILNALLTLLNEREFDNGVKREKTPLIAVVGASNELPQGEELDALYDRFLLRLHVGPVSESGFDSLLNLRGESTPDVPASARLTEADIAAIRTAARNVQLGADVRALLKALRTWCMAEGIQVSDRRWRKVVNLLQTSAVTNGRDAVSIWDCWLLQHCLWREPEQREALFEWYADRVGASAAMDPSHLTRIVTIWEGKLQSDRDSRSQSRDKKGRPLFKPPGERATTKTTAPAQVLRDKKPLYLAPTNARHLKGNDRSNGGMGYLRLELNRIHVELNDGWGRTTEFQHWDGRDAYLADSSNWLMADTDLPPAMEPTRHKPAYINDCLSQLESLQHDVESYAAKLDGHAASLDDQIRNHLWLQSEFAERAGSSLGATRGTVAALFERIALLHSGFEGLPREAEAEAAP